MNGNRLAAGLCLLVTACAVQHLPREADSIEYPGELVSSDEIPGNFLMRQNLRFRVGDSEGSLEVVVQKYCTEILVIGLTSFGSRVFTIRQQGTEVSAESHVPGEWPFPPQNVLMDIHRVYFLPIPSPPPHGWPARGSPWLRTRHGTLDLCEPCRAQLSAGVGNPPRSHHRQLRRASAARISGLRDPARKRENWLSPRYHHGGAHGTHLPVMVGLPDRRVSHPGRSKLCGFGFCDYTLCVSLGVPRIRWLQPHSREEPCRFERLQSSAYWDCFSQAVPRLGDL